jgi:uncharacterized protein (TIGR03067 family)
MRSIFTEVPMRRTVFTLSSVLLCVLALGSDSPKEYDDRTEMVGIEGTWRFTEFEVNGEKWKLSGQNVMIFHRKTYTYYVSGGVTIDGNYRIDTTCKPPHLDYILWLRTVGTGEYIYQIDGDTLKIGFRTDAKGRPQGFNDKDIRIETYKRVK